MQQQLQPIRTCLCEAVIGDAALAADSVAYMLLHWLFSAQLHVSLESHECAGCAASQAASRNNGRIELYLGRVCASTSMPNIINVGSTHTTRCSVWAAAAVCMQVFCSGH
jgi:hypothetical protein